ncbi:dihydrodipicolinate synthase family protein [Chitinophaga sp. GCM10012297]|uniref:Dihydrodipicolinate synthase family protein n=1 Tax=Chitinophaga chungangae TaxID=2821488 RepID=A0ABS3YGD3_9BACT|nr:dihydrodipicolinate synthase family protein [Chitinophaga chungangae]MBO9153751.1 dihydrodipicolinate synthase family protein [Chitinophaga chungangae]
MAVQWKGVYPALTTKFTEEETLDLDLFGRNLDAQLSAGVAGVIIGGSLGEASTLVLEEKAELVRFAVERLKGRIPVILNIAEGATRDAVKQTALAAQWGAEGLMLLPPMRYKSDERETVQYFRSVAESTALPIMLYNNPVDYKIEITPAMFEELAACDNIKAVKESTRDVTNVIRMRNRFGNRFSILCGVDTLTLEELVTGADGLVAGLVCAFPEETVVLYNLVKAGQIKEALELYRWFMPLLELDIHPKLVQYIKLAETYTGLGSEHVRAPRLKLQGEERKRIRQTIEQALATRPDLAKFAAPGMSRVLEK